MATTLNFVQGEAKTIKFTLVDSDGVAVNVSAATVVLSVRRLTSSTSELFNKADGDFDKTSGASGILRVDLSATDLDFSGTAEAILKVTIAATSIDKNVFTMVVREIGVVA